MIASGGRKRDEALRCLYLDPVLKKSVFKALSGMGAQENDILDTFQDALIILDKNVREGKFDGRSTLKTYFVAIAKWHQLSKLRKQGRVELKDDMSAHDSFQETDEEKLIVDEEKRRALKEILKKVGDKCRQLLLLYMQSMPMKEIAERNGIKIQSAKNGIHRCRQKLRKMIAQDPKLKESLKVS